MNWDFPLRESDEGEDWAFAHELPKAQARAQYELLFADSEARIRRLHDFASRFGIELKHDEASLDALNQLYYDAVDSDLLSSHSLRAIIWDVALFIGAMAIERFPDDLRWEFAAKRPSFNGYLSPILVGYRGWPDSKFYVQLFLMLEGDMWLWIGQHTGQIDLNERPVRRDGHDFTRTFWSATTGVHGPPILPLQAPPPAPVTQVATADRTADDGA